MNAFLNECKFLAQEPGRVCLKGRFGQGFAQPANVIYSPRCLMRISGQANSRTVVGDGMFKDTSYDWTHFTLTSIPWQKGYTSLCVQRGGILFCAFIHLWQFAFCNSSAWVPTCLGEHLLVNSTSGRGRGTLRCCCFPAKPWEFVTSAFMVCSGLRKAFSCLLLSELDGNERTLNFCKSNLEVFPNTLSLAFHRRLLRQCRHGNSLLFHLRSPVVGRQNNQMWTRCDTVGAMSHGKHRWVTQNRNLQAPLPCAMWSWRPLWKVSAWTLFQQESW